ncbi:c-1-tetrahydrofolate synthase cytoplasmic-related [Holotrichia oblita]|nr:c-1-tetrahydrofolate synthase cytoplasmic-related [Holotrichia oblita]
MVYLSMSKIVDGAALAAKLKETIKNEVSELTKSGQKINFVAVAVGEHSSNNQFLEKKQQSCAEVGIEMRIVKLDKTATQDKLEAAIKKLSADKNVHGILLQLPMPVGLDTRKAIKCIEPTKDVDGLTYTNFGRLVQGHAAIIPCTALAILHILKSNNIQIEGADAVVIGRSFTVGRSIAALLQSYNATVTVCTKATKDVASYPTCRHYRSRSRCPKHINLCNGKIRCRSHRRRSKPP